MPPSFPSPPTPTTAEGPFSAFSPASAPDLAQPRRRKLMQDNQRVCISPGNRKLGDIMNVSITPVLCCPKGVPCARRRMLCTEGVSLVSGHAQSVGQECTDCQDRSQELLLTDRQDHRGQQTTTLSLACCRRYSQRRLPAPDVQDRRAQSTDTVSRVHQSLRCC